MKKAIVIIYILFSFSCDYNTITRENERLLFENDLLKTKLKEIDDKFVFDSISFRDIYSTNNSYKTNSDFEVELLVVGFNQNKNYFIKYDSLDKYGNLINPDTLKQERGGFKIKTKLKEKENPIKVKMEIQNKYGKSKSGHLFDVIKVKD